MNWTAGYIFELFFMLASRCQRREHQMAGCGPEGLTVVNMCSYINASVVLGGIGRRFGKDFGNVQESIPSHTFTFTYLHLHTPSHTFTC